MGLQLYMDQIARRVATEVNPERRAALVRYQWFVERAIREEAGQNTLELAV